VIEELVMVIPLDQWSPYEGNSEVENHEYSGEDIANPAVMIRRERKSIISPII
jgi:hypothetical protein